MPVFVNYSKKFFLYTSYKVAFSTLMFEVERGAELKYLHKTVDFNVYRHLIKYFHFNSYQLIRNPYDRFLSLFSDKFRNQPKIYEDRNFKWQPVHKLVMPYLNLKTSDSNEKKAVAFLDMSIDNFCEILPEIYLKDGHLSPQKYSASLRILNFRYVPIRMSKYYKIENHKGKISDVIGIDFSKKRNVSNSEDLNKEFTAEAIQIINQLYADDFELGAYDIR